MIVGVVVENVIEICAYVTQYYLHLMMDDKPSTMTFGLWPN